LPLLLESGKIVNEVTDKNAKIIVENYYRERGLGDEEIAVIVKQLEEKGQLVDKAKQYNEIKKQEITKREEEQRRQLEEQQKQREEMVKKFVEDVVANADEFGIDKNKVAEYISIPVAVDGNRQVTQLEIQLQKMYNDPKIFSRLVYWAMNDFSDDIFVKKAKRQVSDDFMKKLNNVIRSPKTSQSKINDGPIWEVFKG